MGVAATVRTEMQNALDATALMLSKEAQGMNGADLGTKADAYFKALFTNPQASNVQITQEFNTPQAGNFSLKITGSASVKSDVRAVPRPIHDGPSASTEVLWGIKKLNLALVLDNTGSMSSSQKMTNLKTAAHNLLDTLKKRRRKSRATSRSRSFRSPPTSTSAPATSTTTGSTGPTGKPPTAPAAAPATRRKAPAVAAARSGRRRRTAQWNGCVYDRDQNNDVARRPRRSPAQSRDDVPRPPGVELPDRDDAAVGRLDRAQYQGRRDDADRQHQRHHRPGLGLPAPDRQSRRSNAPRLRPISTRCIIILTDGQNTQNRWSSSQSTIDTRTQKVCDNIKAANIKLYTVRVIDGNAHAAEELRHQADDVLRRRSRPSSSTACSARSRRTSPTSASRKAWQRGCRGGTPAAPWLPGC